MKKFILVYISLVFASTIKINGQVTTDKLLAHYAMDGSAIDFSGNNFHGILTGTTPSTDRFGNLQGAMNFDGVDDYIELSQFISSFNDQEPVSFSFWVKTNTDAAGVLFSVADGTDITYSTLLGIGDGTTGKLDKEILIASHSENSNEFYISGFTNTKRDTLFDNEWHHVVYVFNGVSTEIYLDKKPLLLTTNHGTNNGGYGNIPNGSKVYIGTRNANGLGAFFKGGMDDFRVYSKILSPTEIYSLYHENICFESISVTDTLIINGNLVSFNPIKFEANIKIYPNPSRDQIFIEPLSNSENYGIKITNSAGIEVFQTSLSTGIVMVDLNTWTGKGLYFINVYNQSGNLIDVKKIIIQ